MGYLKIIFYLFNGRKVKTKLNIENVCEKTEEGEWIYKTANSEFHIHDVEDLGDVLFTGIANLYQKVCNEEAEDITLACGEIVVNLTEVQAFKIKIHKKEEDNPENIVTVEY